MMASDHVEKRMDAVELKLDRTSSSLFQKMDTLAAAINAISIEVTKNRPTSPWVMITAAVGISTLVGMCVTAIFFLVDARVGAATHSSNNFVQEMTTGGNIYVRMHDYNERIKRLEASVGWRPVLLEQSKDR